MFFHSHPLVFRGWGNETSGTVLVKLTVNGAVLFFRGFRGCKHACLSHKAFHMICLVLLASSYLITRSFSHSALSFASLHLITVCCSTGQGQSVDIKHCEKNLYMPCTHVMEPTVDSFWLLDLSSRSSLCLMCSDICCLSPRYYLSRTVLNTTTRLLRLQGQIHRVVDLGGWPCGWY